jgi:carbon monoxide dehydrogenase subunit G
MLTFNGEESFAVPPAKLFAALTDLNQLAAAIPDVVSSRRLDQRSMECVVRPGFSFLRGTLKLVIEIDSLQPPESAELHVIATGIGVQMRVESQLKVSPTDVGSKLLWTAAVTELKGLVATVPQSLISAAANQVVQQSWKKIHTRLDPAM